MSIFLVNLAKTILAFAAIVALAPVAYPSTISSYSISTTSADGTPCSVSGTGPGSASCFSETPPTSHFSPADAAASVTLTDNSIQLIVGSFHASNAQVVASITHDDFYSVPVNGPVSALEALTCTFLGTSVGTLGHFSLGSTNVSPPVETIYIGASQGSGPCGPNQIAGAPLFVVSLVAANNIVHLQTRIDASGNVTDFSGSLLVKLTVNGFQDANGNPITATLLPEPGTLGTFGLALLVGLVAMRAQQKRSAEPMVRIRRLEPMSIFVVDSGK